MDLKQKLIDSSTFSNFKTLEEIKEKIKTFMLATTYNENYEDWTQRFENGVEIHHIQVFKFIIEVNEQEVEEEPNKNPLAKNSIRAADLNLHWFKVSIYTETVTIRYGGSLWNQFEFCLEALTEYLDKQNLEPDHENLEPDHENLEWEPENLEWAPLDEKEENEVEGEQDIPWYDEGKNAELDAKLEALYNAEPTMMEMTLSEPDYVRPDF
jgi:hypothetical protein